MLASSTSEDCTTATFTTSARTTSLAIMPSPNRIPSCCHSLQATIPSRNHATKQSSYRVIIEPFHYVLRGIVGLMGLANLRAAFRFTVQKRRQCHQCMNVSFIGASGGVEPFKFSRNVMRRQVVKKTSSHLYMRLCPSVFRSVSPSVRPSIRQKLLFSNVQK